MLKEIKLGDVISMSMPEGSYTYEDVTILQIPQIQGQPWVFRRTNGQQIAAMTNSPIVPTPEQSSEEARVKVAEFVQQHGVPQQWTMYNK